MGGSISRRVALARNDELVVLDHAAIMAPPATIASDNCRLGGGGLGLGGRLAAVALGVELEDGGVMDEAVDSGDGHHFVSKDAVPFAKRLVAGDDYTAALVPVGNQLKQRLTFAVTGFDVTDVVND